VLVIPNTRLLAGTSSGFQEEPADTCSSTICPESMFHTRSVSHARKETRQELLTLSGAGSLLLGAGWSSDGDAILAGPPWQAWRAPSWEEIASAETNQISEKISTLAR
jgi:hypothetical protein